MKLAGIFVLCLAGDAAAHIQLMSPSPRTLELKVGPCGIRSARRGNVTPFAPGATIDVVWKETTGHPGHYRISFDADGEDDFVDPRSFTDLNTAPSVLLDNIADRSGNLTYTQPITLPNITCGNCTLQVIQVMTDKPPYGDGDDIYYQCADLVLGTPADAAVPTGDGGVAADAGGDGGGDDGGCGCTTGRRSGGGLPALGMVGLFAVMALCRATRRTPRPTPRPTPRCDREARRAPRTRSRRSRDRR